MMEQITEWWGRLIAALYKGEFEVLALSEVKGQVLLQLKDGSVYSVERLGATLRDE